MRWIRIIFIGLLMGLVLASGCAPSTAPPPQETEAQSVGEPGHEWPDLPDPVFEFLVGAASDDYNDFDELDGQRYEFENLEHLDGLVEITSNAEFAGYIFDLEKIDSRAAYLLRFLLPEDVNFGFSMQSGVRDQPDFAEWAVVSGFEGRYWIGDEYVHIPMEGSVDFEPETWYDALIAVTEDGAVLAAVWETDNPGAASFVALDLGEPFMRDGWNMEAYTQYGTMQIDTSYVIQFDTFDEDVTLVVEQDQLEPPSLIFHNGRVLTMDSEMQTVEALAVLGDRIVAVGSDDEILALAGASTQLIDLGGHALLPGFVDAHTHILNDAENYLGLTLEEAQDLALENGITTLANMFVNPSFVRTLRSLDASGDLRVRTSAYLIATDNCGNPQGDWYRQYPPTDEFGEMLRIGGVKIFLDGGTCGYAAVSQETHPGAGQGDLFLSDDELVQLVSEADDAGYQIAIHALGDRAIDQAIDALNAVIDAPGNPERHRVEHSFYMVDGQFARYSEMGVHPVIFGYWPTCEAAGSDRTQAWRDSIRRWRELVEANPGLMIVAKTDLPWMGPATPLLELYSLTTLKEEATDGSICEPAAWLADRTITIEQALPMVTINAAYVLFRDDELGSLEPGKLADLIILSASPLDVDVGDIKDIEVWMTMVGGETAYCAPGRLAYCP